jgi:hypothetical protein
MIVIASNMKEACQYLEEKKARNRAHRTSVIIAHGECTKFNSDDYKQVKTKMKSNYGAKGRQFSHTKLWNHNNLTLAEIKQKY